MSLSDSDKAYISVQSFKISSEIMKSHEEKVTSRGYLMGFLFFVTNLVLQYLFVRFVLL